MDDRDVTRDLDRRDLAVGISRLFVRRRRFERTETAFLLAPSSEPVADVLGKTCARNQIAYCQLNTGRDQGP